MFCPHDQGRSYDCTVCFFLFDLAAVKLRVYWRFNFNNHLGLCDLDDYFPFLTWILLSNLYLSESDFCLIFCISILYEIKKMLHEIYSQMYE